MNKSKATGPVESEIRARRLVIVDDQGRDRIVLGTNDDGKAEIKLLGADGRAVFVADVHMDGSKVMAGLMLQADAAGALVSASVIEGQDPEVEIFDRNGNPRDPFKALAGAR